MNGERIGKYRILRELGRGGMGIVYLAEDEALDRKVALKVLPPEMRGDDTARQRFLQEAKSAAALDHPFVCHVHETGESAPARRSAKAARSSQSKGSKAPRSAGSLR